MIEATAPAKINLFLHVGPTRPDGLHAIASLFVFADGGDRIRATRADRLSLTIEGPFAAALKGFPPEENLVWRAAEALARETGVNAGAALVLEKKLPIAAGIGGGSADAAATLHALVELWRLDIAPDALSRLAFGLGADVPACLARRPVYVEGAGEVVTAGPSLPPLWACLVNPRVETPTGPIFRAFDAANPSPPPPALERRSVIAGLDALRAYLAGARNDLEPHAINRQRVIGAARDFLAHCPGCLIARLSGSGATVFGLFSDKTQAEEAQARAESEGWWAMAARLLEGDGA